MAHYVFQRNNGWGDYDYIRNFETMEITDYPEFAAQVDDKYMGFIDIPYLNSLGFFPIGITSLALRIVPMLLFAPTVRGYRPAIKPRPARLRGAPRGPRPTTGPMPMPRPVGRRVGPAAVRPAPVGRGAAPRPAPRTTAPKAAPRPATRTAVTAVPPAVSPALPGRKGGGRNGGGMGPGPAGRR
ncbi:MAG: hypothetical protein IJU28_11080 [Clostridia bacterium]|nr:hypothetical protein [Clostridia bacterium]